MGMTIHHNESNFRLLDQGFHKDYISLLSPELPFGSSPSFQCRWDRSKRVPAAVLVVLAMDGGAGSARALQGKESSASWALQPPRASWTGWDIWAEFSGAEKKRQTCHGMMVCFRIQNGCMQGLLVLYVWPMLVFNDLEHSADELLFVGPVPS